MAPLVCHAVAKASIKFCASPKRAQQRHASESSEAQDLGLPGLSSLESAPAQLPKLGFLST